MKKAIIVSGLILSMFVSGCQTADQGEQLNNPRPMGISVGDQEEGFYNENNNPKRYGYVRKMKDTAAIQQNHDVPQLNRDDIADAVTSIVVALPDVNEAATLVTDDKVLIGYQTEAGDKSRAANQVTQAAIGAVPRYYDVYVSDQDGIIENIARFSNLQSTTKNAEDILDETLDQMDRAS